MLINFSDCYVSQASEGPGRVALGKGLPRVEKDLDFMLRTTLSKNE